MSDYLVWAIMAPLIGSLLCILWPRRAGFLALSSVGLGLISSIMITCQVYQSGPVSLHLGDWAPGLGIALRADAMSSILLLMCMVVVTATSLYATSYFSDAGRKSRFWPLWLMMVVALSGILLSGDIFNLYVTLELLGLSAVALTALSDNRAALQAAIRYLTIGLLGSLAFLAGVALMYTGYGTLDMLALSSQVQANPLSGVALTLMTAGLIIKSALFPLHFWLPAAHASAPAPVSAALSALVVKVSVYILLRFWLDVFDTVLTQGATWVLGLAGSVAILWGSWQALHAQRLKLLAAYSTVAQVGYLFLFLPLIAALPPGPGRETAFTALLLLALTHGFAKSALFLSAGSIQRHAGHDRIAELAGTARALPLTTFVIALSGVALIGLPPSGSFIAKWHLLSSVVQTGQWPWIAVIGTGSLLAGAYTFRVLGYAFGPDDRSGKVISRAGEEVPAFILALAATVLLGLGSAPLWDFVRTGTDFIGY